MPMYKRPLLLLLIFISCSFFYTMYNASQEENTAFDQGEVVRAEGSKDFEEEKVAVYVTGAVAKPGVVYVESQARAERAIELCGGILPEGDMASVNLAQTVKEGLHINIREKKAPVKKFSAGGENHTNSLDRSPVNNVRFSNIEMSGDGKVNINTAGVQELTKLSGIGAALAGRIVEYRETKGDFNTIDDIKKVKGIGKAKFAKIKEQIEI